MKRELLKTENCEKILINTDLMKENLSIGRQYSSFRLNKNSFFPLVKSRTWYSTPLQAIILKDEDEKSLISLSCGCFGYPIPNIYWQQSSLTDREWRNATELLKNESTGSYERNSTLFIPALDSYLFYRYRCICSNIHGNITTNSTLLLFPCTYIEIFVDYVDDFHIFSFSASS